MSQFDFSGVITAVVTPFNKGRVDLKSFERLLQFQLEQGIQGLVINGTTGESPCLESEEVRDLLKTARTCVGGKVPLLLGTGSNSTLKTIYQTEQAQEWGADAALVVAPYYNKPPQRGLREHFKQVAASVDIPILLYNVPGRTVVSLTQETIKDLSRVENIIGVKEATGDLAFGERLLSAVDSEFLVTSGDDGSCVDLALRGARGVISVVSHIIPRELVMMMSRAYGKDAEVAEEYRTKYKHLLAVLYAESNPIPVKMAVYQMGLIDSPEMRLPLVELNSESAQEMKSILSQMEKLP